MEPDGPDGSERAQHTDRTGPDSRDVTPLSWMRDPELWYGGDYELALAMPLGSLDTPTRLRLLQALWGDPLTTGVVTAAQELGVPWQSVEAELAERTPLYGCLRMRERLVGCDTTFLDNEYEAWCLLCIPMGMVDQLYPVDYAHYEANTWWIAELDALLADIAMRVYAQIPFELGIVGHEASATLIYLDGLGPKTLTRTDLLVPEAQFERLGVTPHGHRSAKGLWWTEATG